jgi:hypothetical protein
MGLHDSFGHLKHKLLLKERLRIKLTICLPIIKSKKSPWFFCMQVACHIPLNNSQQRLQIYFRPHINWRSTHKLWAPKVVKVPIVGISRLSPKSPRTKWYLNVDPMVKHKVYYKGEGGSFFQVWAMVSLVSLCLTVIRLYTKVLQLCTNQLVVWFLCRSVWVIELLVNLLSPISELQHALLPLKCYELKNVPELLLLLLFSPLSS